MALPKKTSFLLVADYRAVNQRVELIPRRSLGQVPSSFRRNQLDCHPRLVAGFLQMLMDKEGEEAFTMVTRQGLLLLRRVPQGLLNPIPRFQLMMDMEMLAGLVRGICKM